MFWPFRRLFYGWAVAWTALVVAFAHASVYGPVVGIFVKPIQDELGWSRSEIALAFTLGSFAGMAAGAPVGWIVDRIGSRAVVVVSGVVITFALLGMAAMTSPWHYWLSLGVGRGMAMGGVQMGTAVAVSNWFIRKRGRAAGMSSFGVRSGQALLPLLALPIMAAFGWRQAFFALACVSMALVVIPALVYLRRRPEDHGLLPDGDVAAGSPWSNAMPGGSSREEENWTVQEAMRTKAMWLLVVATGLAMFGQTMANVHAIAHVQDRGLALAPAITITSIFAGVSALSTVPWGLILERIAVRYGITFVALLNGGALVVLSVADSYALAALYGVMAGTAGGGFIVAMRLAWPNYYGRFSVGRIRGIASLATGGIGPMGPLFAGLLYDRTGTYAVAFSVSAALFVLAAVAAWLATPPERKVGEAP